MIKVKQLDQKEKGANLALAKKGVSNREIGNRSIYTTILFQCFFAVRTAMERTAKTEIIKKSPDGVRSILGNVSNTGATASQLKIELNLLVSPKAVSESFIKHRALGLLQG